MNWRAEIRFGPMKRRSKVGVPADRFLPAAKPMTRSQIKRHLKAVRAERARRSQEV